uniref:Calmodulin-binding protein n=1 Tax=Sesuvium portulacastrum TaxID=221166 RepID=A0A2I7ZAQ7_SESPO|nr:calmodulin-binding protein [Sesuvium portulacastrum]
MGENMASLETWAFRPAFDNSWISEAFARDTEVLTKALQRSISSDCPTSSSSPPPPPIDVSCTYSDLLNVVVKQPETPPSLTSSGGGGGGGVSEPETASKRIPKNPGPPTGKITKRKSRASKRSPTTFITADPANFRQMVQQVTGVRFVGGSNPVGSVYKPEPQRANGGNNNGVVNRLQAGCLLPTLDTSAFLLDHHHQQVGPATTVVGPQVGASSLGSRPPAVVADGGGPGLDFDGFSGFPTLESWKVM